MDEGFGESLSLMVRVCEEGVDAEGVFVGEGLDACDDLVVLPDEVEAVSSVVE